MKKYIMQGDSLSTSRVSEIINDFQMTELPKINKMFNYYNGKQAILNRIQADTSKQYEKIVTNFCKIVTDNYQGFITGKPITYEGDNIEDIKDILNYNDVIKEDSTLLRQALIAGISYEMFYCDELGKVRFTNIDSRQCIPVYSDTVENTLMAVIRFYVNQYSPLESEYWVEVYDNTSITTYKAESGFLSLTPYNKIPHYFKDVPFTIFYLNDEAVGIFSQGISLQDAYNDAISDLTDDANAFSDAYLVLTGVQAEEEDIVSMKKNRVLMLPEGASANFLVKDSNQSNNITLATTIKQNFFSVCSSPDFNSEEFNASTGIALRIKCLAFQNTSASIENNMRMALQRRIELICNILNLTADEYLWRDTRILFTENFPVETENIANMVNTLRGLVSNETLLSQLPFIEDAKEEMLKVNAENSYSQYSNLSHDSEGVFEDFSLNQQFSI